LYDELYEVALEHNLLERKFKGYAHWKWSVICKFAAHTAQWWELHKNLSDGKSQYTPLKNLSIFTRLVSVDDTNQHGEVFRFSSLVPANKASKSTLPVEDSSYKKLWTKIVSRYKIRPAAENHFGLVYRNAYWGNKLVRFSDEGQSSHCHRHPSLVLS
jgi:hypothetical protein